MTVERSISVREFERCWPWLEASIDFTALKQNGLVLPTHRKEHVWDLIRQGHVMFWSNEECTLVTEFITKPSGLKSHNVWIGGGNLQAIVKGMETIEDWGRVNDCHRQTGGGRRGWLRACKGYHVISVQLGKPLI